MVFSYFHFSYIKAAQDFAMAKELENKQKKRCRGKKEAVVLEKDLRRD